METDQEAYHGEWHGPGHYSTRFKTPQMREQAPAYWIPDKDTPMWKLGTAEHPWIAVKVTRRWTGWTSGS